MELKIRMPKVEVVSLRQLNPGDIFSLADSGSAPEDLFGAFIDPKKNLFMIFNDDKNPSNGRKIDAVSLGGDQVLRLSDYRTVHKVKEFSIIEGEASKDKKMISELSAGTIVRFNKKLSMVVKRKASPQHEIFLISLALGLEKLVVDSDDSDLLVQYYPDARINVVLDFS